MPTSSVDVVEMSASFGIQSGLVDELQVRAVEGCSTSAFHVLSKEHVRRGGILEVPSISVPGGSRALMLGLELGQMTGTEHFVCDLIQPITSLRT
jgi:hypothetical protein